MTSPLAAALSFFLLLATPAFAAEMVMFEQPGCAWCKRFNEEVAPAWPNTEQGQRAPLRRVNIHEPLPEDLADIPVERFTPTFVLVDEGREIARLRGYPGDQFFWALVDEMLAKLEP
ncbi:MAG: thioredoxin family protein [Hoeflea sp.]|uniref:thioredoxin family protein n=1 Tax=Hoeflea sp. TaxID=1940281 RepID=UPI001DE0C501|nr:thioredoxin family protein [Hoeflea sp.]MBU4528805.1 thioredoxin family protein [Alphaproteobacteria bacterium]MBU4545868.1 thioredoxin family protein [Alphaproteobacteria bacterium]MBU4549939.1 thioredoxin family protein [Alphaproteobacteria bacterium]MBV1725936.1 thioredoxin family protein [Hoeflea sp.]MBV1762661.1 thioredoxin family protein [Hoeflea sp.]